MQLIKPYLQLWGRTSTNIDDQILWIERAGRVCYRSEDKIIDGSGRVFVQGIINRGHTSVIEHSNFVLRVPSDRVSSEDLLNILIILKDTFVRCCMKEDYFYVHGNLRAFLVLAQCIGFPIETKNFPFYEFPQSLFPQFELCKDHSEIPKDLWYLTFEMVTDRAVSHELVRHRVLSFSQESQRYCKYGELKVIRPFYYSEQRLKDPDVKERFLEFTNGVKAAEDTYKNLRQKGEPPEYARYSLPNITATKVVVSGYLPHIKGVLELRDSSAAFTPFRLLAQDLKNQMIEQGLY